MQATDTSSWRLPATFNAANFPAATVLELVVSGAMLVLAASAWLRLRRKPNKITLTITIVFLAMCLAAISTAIGKLLVLLELIDYPTLQHVFYNDMVSLTFMTVAIIFTFKFALDMFHDLDPTTSRTRFFTFSAPLAIAVTGQVIVFVVRIDSPLALAFQAVIFGFSVFTYSVLLVKASHVATRSSGVDGVAIRFISLSGFASLIFFLFFSLDVMDAFNLGNFSWLYFIAWPAAVVATLFTHIGYFRPPWLERAWTARVARRSPAS